MKRTLAAIAAAGIALAAAPTAHADDSELVYLQLLNLRGLTVDNTALALATGYRTCDQLNRANGAEVIPWMVRNYAGMTREHAAIVMVSAVQALCPWHDHTGEL